jgi:hypothetical protein
VKDRRVMINIDGQDTFPIRLPRDRMAWLILPTDFGEADVERLTKWLHLIAEGSVDKSQPMRPVGPDAPGETTGDSATTNTGADK